MSRLVQYQFAEREQARPSRPFRLLLVYEVISDKGNRCWWSDIEELGF